MRVRDLSHQDTFYLVGGYRQYKYYLGHEILDTNDTHVECVATGMMVLIDLDKTVERRRMADNAEYIEVQLRADAFIVFLQLFGKTSPNQRLELGISKEASDAAAGAYSYFNKLMRAEGYPTALYLEDIDNE